jgi:glycine/D-amino acid oxidase-like deaminating enzyme
MGTAGDTNYPRLKEDVSVDVAIIGGGIVGVTTAALLRDSGMDVILVEAKHIGQGVTGNTTAKITSLHHLIYDYLITNFGERNAKLYGEANQEAIDRIRKFVEEYNIDCGFSQTTSYTFAEKEGNYTRIENEVTAAEGLGLPASLVRDLELPFETHGAIRFDDQARFHTLIYLQGLVKEIKDDVGIYENTRALNIELGEPNRILTDGGEIRAEDLVVSTHWPILDQPGLYYNRMFQRRSYALGLKIRDEFPEGMYIGVEDDSHSFRIHNGGEDTILIVGGGIHRSGQGGDTVQYYQDLHDYTAKIFDINSVL